MSRRSFEIYGNGNPALNESLLASDPVDRIRVGRQIINPILERNTSQILQTLGYTGLEIEGLSPISTLLDLPHQRVKSMLAWHFKDPNNKSPLYSAIESPYNGMAAMNVYLEGNEKPVSRFWVMGRYLYDDDERLRQLLKATEIPYSPITHSKNLLMRGLRKAGILSDAFLKREEVTSDVIYGVVLPNGLETQVQRLREVGLSGEHVLLGQVVR